MPRCVIFPTMGRHHPYTAALVQMAMGDDPADNLARAVGFVEEAASRGARLVCLPELFRCRYFCQTEDAAAFSLAESARDGPTRRMLGEAARRLGVVVVAPLFEERGPGLYHNSALVIEGDGSVAGLYRKMHVPDDPGYMEKYYFAPGDLGFPVHSTRLGRVGVLICWDQWYPEAARIAALRGAHVLFYPTAIGWHPREKERCGRRQLEAWRAVQRGHAVANAFYVAAVNRVGLEVPPSGGEGIEFWGRSFVVDPYGEVVDEAGGGEEIVYAEIDPRRVAEARAAWPFFRDRRVDAYGDITAMFLDEE